jgi:hypothetical protein
MFITMLTTALTHPYPEANESSSRSHPIPLRSFLILFFRLRPGLQNYVFPSVFAIRNLYEFSFPLT